MALDGRAQPPDGPCATSAGTRPQHSDPGDHDARVRRDRRSRCVARRAAEAPVRMCASGHRSGHAHAAHAADGPRARRGGDRTGFACGAEDDWTTIGACQDEDSKDADRVRDSPTSSDSAASRSGAKRDLCRVRQRLGGRNRRRRTHQGSRTGGDLACARAARADSGRSGSSRPARIDAPLRGAPPRTPQRRRPVRAAFRAGSARLAHVHDRGSRRGTRRVCANAATGKISD